VVLAQEVERAALIAMTSGSKRVPTARKNLQSRSRTNPLRVDTQTLKIVHVGWCLNVVWAIQLIGEVNEIGNKPEIRAARIE
jgi:hypothetical protein